MGGGSIFRREHFKIVEQAPAEGKTVRYWDLAASDAGENSDPDYTASAWMRRTESRFYLKALQFRGRSLVVEEVVKQCAQVDGPGVPIWIEQEPGAGSKNLIGYYARLLAGYTVHADPKRKDKLSAAAPLASQAEAGNIYLINGPWVSSFLDQATAFDGSGNTHDDMVDAASGAFSKLTLTETPALLEYMRREHQRRMAAEETNG
jgi:predicted phage terminase large subunit-like protein